MYEISEPLIPTRDVPSVSRNAMNESTSRAAIQNGSASSSSKKRKK